METGDEINIPGSGSPRAVRQILIGGSGGMTQKGNVIRGGYGNQEALVPMNGTPASAN